MSKELTLRVDEFAEQTLGRFTREGDPAAVTTACLYYLADRNSGRAGWRLPRFLGQASSPRGWTVRVDDETWAAITDEAERQGCPPDTLLLHALLYFVADLDSGRIATLLQEALAERQ